jgi:membrane-bound lytic murein transglycosylase MltF
MERLRKRTRAFLLAATTTIIAAFPGLAHALDLKEVEARGSIRALVSADEQPEMFALTENTDPGVEREILDGFAKAHGVKVEVTTVATFDQITPTLVRGDGDLIIGIIDTESRRHSSPLRPKSCRPGTSWSTASPRA